MAQYSRALAGSVQDHSRSRVAPPAHVARAARDCMKSAGRYADLAELSFSTHHPSIRSLRTTEMGMPSRRLHGTVGKPRCNATSAATGNHPLPCQAPFRMPGERLGEASATPPPRRRL